MVRANGRPPAWLTALKERAWEAYRDLPAPERTSHAWRYTDPKALLPEEEEIRDAGRVCADGASPWCEACAGDFEEEDSPVGIALNGRTQGLSLPSRFSGAGLILMDLEEAAREHEELVRPHLANLLPGDGGKFEALNLAALSGGFFLYIPAGLELDEPIYLFNSHDDGARFSAPRILVVADRGSRATIFTEFVGSADSGRNDRNGFHRVDAVLEFFVGRSSRVSHVAIQRLSRRCSGYVTSLARLEEDSRLDTIVTSFGGAVLKMDTGVFMEGEGSEGELVGFAFGEGNQRLDHRTVYGHRAQHTNSRLDFKVVLKEEARSAYTGLLRISEDAPFCEAYQENRNILLSDGARADSIPELEILNEEVHCSHGATVGPIDPDEIFYLASRGIRKTDALRMVVGGFLEPTLTRIPAGVQGKIRRCVNERLSVL